MILVVLTLFLLFLPLTKNENLEDYLSKDSTLSIKGFFVIWVFLAHFGNYVTSPNSKLGGFYLTLTYGL